MKTYEDPMERAVRLKTAELREALYPDVHLPIIELVNNHGEDDAGITTYHAWSMRTYVGITMLRRCQPRVGLQTIKVETLAIKIPDQWALYREATEVAILAIAAVSNCSLVTDPHGSTPGEADMWQRFGAHGVATIIESFTERPRPDAGQAVFDGQAFALPFTSIG